MTSDVERFMAAIRKLESGGNYTAIGPPTPYGRATGAYQFIDSTWGGYAGHRRAADASKAEQDARARALMSAYHRQFGRWDLVAVAWHAGPGTAQRAARDPAYLKGVTDGYLPTASYVKRVMATFNGSRPAAKRPARTNPAAEIKPWRLPRNTVGAKGRIVIDPDLLLGLARDLTGQLADVEAALHRTRWARERVGGLALADNGLERRLRGSLDSALGDWDGLRRLPYLMTRDIGMVVQARERALAADGGVQHARETVTRLLATLRGGPHSERIRHHVGDLMRALYRPDGRGTHLREHRPPVSVLPPAHKPTPKPDAKHDKLADVQISGGWGGAQSIFRQFVTPFMHSAGINPGSQKRSYDTVDGPGMSDHYTGSRNSYAIDYPTYSGEDEARRLAKAMGYQAWQPNSYNGFTVSVDGRQFRVQILWGAGIDHGDHVHVGIRRL